MRKNNTNIRSTVVKTKLTDTEKEKLDRLCEMNGLSRSGFIRQAVFTGKIIPAKASGTADGKLLDALGSLISEYGKIGSNLNQIARHLNSGGVFNEEIAGVIRKISSYLENLKHELLKLLGRIYGNDKTSRL